MLKEIISRKASASLVSEAFLFRSGPLCVPHITNTVRQINAVIDIVNTIKSSKLLYHTDVLGEYCTVVLYEDPEQSIVIDKNGSVFNNIPFHVLHKIFGDICSSLDFSVVHSYCISGKITPIGLFRSYPINMNNYMNRFFRTESNTNHVIYNYDGTCSLMDSTEVIDTEEFSEYIDNLEMYNNTDYDKTYDVLSNINTYNKILISSTHNSNCYIRKNNSETTTQYETLYSTYNNDDSLYYFYPYVFNYSITKNNAISLVAGSYDVNELRDDLLSVSELNSRDAEEVDELKKHIKDRLFVNDNDNKTNKISYTGIIVKNIADSYANSLDIKITNGFFMPLNHYIKYSDSNDLSSKYSSLIRLYTKSNAVRGKILTDLSSASPYDYQSIAKPSLMQLYGLENSRNLMSSHN